MSSYRAIQAFNKKRTLKDGDQTPTIAHQSHLHQRRLSNRHAAFTIPQGEALAGWTESQITDFNSNVIEYTVGLTGAPEPNPPSQSINFRNTNHNFATANPPGIQQRKHSSNLYATVRMGKEQPQPKASPLPLTFLLAAAQKMKSHN